MADILDRQHALAGEYAGAGGGCELQMSADAGFGFDKAAIRLKHRNIILRQPEGRIHPHQFIRAQNLMRQVMFA